jgi:hypothetical protein
MQRPVPCWLSETPACLRRQVENLDGRPASPCLSGSPMQVMNYAVVQPMSATLATDRGGHVAGQNDQRAQVSGPRDLSGTTIASAQRTVAIGIGRHQVMLGDRRSASRWPRPMPIMILFNNLRTSPSQRCCLPPLAHVGRRTQTRQLLRLPADRWRNLPALDPVHNQWPLQVQSGSRATGWTSYLSGTFAESMESACLHQLANTFRRNTRRTKHVSIRSLRLSRQWRQLKHARTAR